VQKALERADDTLVDRLAEIESRFQVESDPVEAGAIVLTFHATMIDAAQSNRIKALFRAISTVIPSGFFAYVPRAVDVEREILPTIVSAMRAGDAATAAAEYQLMMDRIGDEVVTVLRFRGLFDAQPLDESP
jgi:DNA-binding GntR family transcriptional regulator